MRADSAAAMEMAAAVANWVTNAPGRAALGAREMEAAACWPEELAVPADKSEASKIGAAPQHRLAVGQDAVA